MREEFFYATKMRGNGQLPDSGKFRGAILNHRRDSSVTDAKPRRDYSKCSVIVLTRFAACSLEEFGARTESERKTESGGVATFYGENENTQATEVQNGNQY